MTLNRQARRVHDVNPLVPEKFVAFRGYSCALGEDVGKHRHQDNETSFFIRSDRSEIRVPVASPSCDLALLRALHSGLNELSYVDCILRVKNPHVGDVRKGLSLYGAREICRRCTVLGKAFQTDARFQSSSRSP